MVFILVMLYLGDDMRKFLFLLFLMIVMSGCSIGNTPTSKVEDLLSKYQKVDDSIDVTSYRITNDMEVDEKIEEKFKKVIRSQYRNLAYEVKDEKVDGDNAVVTVEVKVSDFGKILDKYDSGAYSKEDYYNTIVDEMESTKEKVTYTIEFELLKNSKGEWVVSDLTVEQQDKLLGIY